jgi:hypothetical protein
VSQIEWRLSDPLKPVSLTQFPPASPSIRRFALLIAVAAGAAAIVAFRALPLDRIVQRLSMLRNLERLRRLM